MSRSNSPHRLQHVSFRHFVRAPLKRASLPFTLRVDGSADNPAPTVPLQFTRNGQRVVVVIEGKSALTATLARSTLAKRGPTGS